MRWREHKLYGLKGKVCSWEQNLGTADLMHELRRVCIRLSLKTSKRTSQIVRQLTKMVDRGPGS
jgi:hypothetical protein